MGGCVPLERGHLRAETVMSPGCGVPAGLEQHNQVGLEALLAPTGFLSNETTEKAPWSAPGITDPTDPQ